MTRFLQELLRYISARPVKEIRRLPPADLADEVLTGLRGYPYLVILDGFERLLTAYHRFDPSKVRDEEAEAGKRSLIEPNADEIVRGLTAAGPSKILISTRLMPLALEGRFGQQMPGVRRLRLPGLTDADTRTLLGRLGVRGSEPAIAGFFGPLGNHPLLAGVVASLVRDYRAAPGDFDRWLADPTNGGALTVPGLDLTQRRTHILAAALSGLEPGPRRLLGWISVLAGSVTWDTLAAINPFQPEPDPQDQGRSSEPALRARAQLDAALKDLEDRGLVWWDRSSNSYDLHPIIRAYAYDQLENTDRIQANDRVRDHFEDLPPEDPAGASSVEDLTQTITIFRALVGAGHVAEASYLWADFGMVLLVDLGAYATIIELLSPLAAAGTPVVRSSLAIAYYETGRYDEAISQDTTLLADSLRAENDDEVMRRLRRLGHYFRESGAYLTASRCSDLQDAVHAAGGHEADGNQYQNRAYLATLQGRVDQARGLLSQAEELGPPPASPWFNDAIDYGRLYLALVADQSLTHAQLDEAVSRVRSWAFRRGLAELRYELLVRQGEFEQALAAAHEHEHLGRNVGLEVAPAASAFVLAKLGRASEATAAVEESLARFSRIHPAQRPHRSLARALWELARPPEAAAQASLAYRKAWADGPPNCSHWALRNARELLQAMGEPIPDLPVLDPATVKAPLEDEVRAFIARLEANKAARDVAPRRSAE
jgi:tetratricopeptide (TPR) repeat protein